ncbi:histidine--tRNA ligase [Candidatus Uhrbacteria bacterium]|nr:histidine--tRNA ligase [Candidatus Uhrbacteria bacterium]
MPMTKKNTAKPKEAKPAAGPAKKGPAPINLVRGMKDILPADQPYWDMMRRKADELSKAYGFERIDTPVLEETALFVRGVGKLTDIVEKEMYAFDTVGGEHVCLRPEDTAPIVRSYIQHGMLNLPQPVKLWYLAPMFRHDRPQHGRYRQFWQYGCEILGDSAAVVDAQLIFLAYLFLKELGIESTVQINSIGTPESRANYKNALVSFFRSRRNKLSEEDKKRLLKNPLRVLDSKDPAVMEMKAEAPQIVDWLDEDSKAHFMRVLEFLDEMKVPYELNPYLVRGLDYYTRTVFELYANSGDQDLAQSAVCGGGRYDGLSEVLGGRPTPAAGFAMGLDRIFSLLKEQNVAVAPETADVFVAQLGDQGRKRALAVFEELRKAGIPAGEAFSKDSIKAQMELANKLKVKIVVIIGQKEVLDGTAVIRDMDSGTQEIVDVRKIVHEINKKLGQVQAH